jgi:2-polyprenyl-6-methoxyphenol hydroxylase-like FAD-dependent oxidoreductase
MDYETTDVIICGCGPTGALLSAQLGRSKVSNIVLEKEAEITTDPRGIALDEDGIRALQSVGLYDKVYSEIGQCMGIFNFIGGVHQVLDTKPFMQLDQSTTEGGTGHVGFICHKQPALEAALRSAMASTEHSTLRVGSTLTSISEDTEWVYATYADKDGNEHRLRGKFLVGADGKTGFTRKKYLEPKGVKMEQVSATSYQSTWVALNWKMTLPTEKTHPKFPLWRLGYTPEEVYNLFFPVEFRFLCNPERPAVCGRFGLLRDRLWRFEFEIQHGEDGMEMSEPEQIRKIVYPYIRHAGSRYGLAEDVQYPDDCIEILRSRPFWFSARSCNVWAMDRVVLCGDSAHVFPPFGGQGIASGFRDASALAWRLQLACRPGFRSYQAAFRAWYEERKQQLERSLAATVRNGEYVTEGNWLKILIRNTMLWVVQLIPAWKRQLQMGQRADGMIRYKHAPGLTFLPEFGGGVCLPQVYCVPDACKDVEEEVAAHRA